MTGSEIIKGAKKQLLIYDPKISDKSIIGLLQQKREQGVDICIIGSSDTKGVNVRELARLRLHAGMLD